MNSKLFTFAIVWALLLTTLSHAATKRWVGAAQDIEQIDTITVADTWAQGDTVTLEINNKQTIITMGASTTTTTAVAAAIAEAIEATSHDEDDFTADMSLNMGGYEYPEFRDVRSEVSGSVVSVIGQPGVPFTLTVTETTAGDGTASESADTTGVTGKNWLDNADNWSSGTAPATGDVLVFDHGNTDVLYGLDNAATDLRWYVYSSYTGNIGLPKLHVSPGGLTYSEYRQRRVDVPITSTSGVVQLFIGDQVPITTTAGRRYFDLGTTTGATCDVVVYDAGAMTADGHSVQILGGRVIDAKVSGGAVSFGDEAGANACQFDTLQITRRTGASIPKVYVGGQAVLNSGSAVTNDGGELIVGVSGSNATFQLYSGTTSLLSSTAAGTAHVRQGATLRCFGAVTTLYVYGGGIFDASQSTGLTVTNATAYPAAAVHDPKGLVTWSNGLDVVGGALHEITWTTKDSLTLTPSDL